MRRGGLCSQGEPFEMLIWDGAHSVWFLCSTPRQPIASSARARAFLACSQDGMPDFTTGAIIAIGLLAFGILI